MIRFCALLKKNAAFIFILLGLLGLGASYTYADRIGSIEEVPIVKDLSLEVVRGEEVDILLKAATGSIYPLEFIIRKPPNGGEIKMAPKLLPGKVDQAVLTYESDIGFNKGVDIFHYAARVPGGRVSASGVVSIKIIEPVLILDAVGEIDFGNIALGEKTTRTLLLKNTGSISFRQKISLLPPWSFIDKQKKESNEILVSLKPREEIFLNLCFRSGQLRDINTQIPLPGNGRQSISLKAKSIQILKITPRKLSLQYDPKTKMRRAIFVITNQSKSEQQVTVEVPAPCVSSEKSLSLLPAQSKEIQLTLGKEPLGHWVGEVTLSTGSPFSLPQIITTSAKALPPILQFKGLSPAKEIDFGIIKEDQPTYRALKVENTGGMQTTLTLHAQAPFFLKKQAPPILLPGETMEILLGIDQNAPPSYYRKSLKIKSKAGEWSFVIVADLIRGTQKQESYGPNSQSSSYQKTQSSKEKKLSPLLQKYGAAASQVLGIPVKKRRYTSNVPTIKKIRIEHVSPHTLTLSWERPEGAEPYTYAIEIEHARLLKEQSFFGRFWEEYPHLQIKEKGTRLHATLYQLPPRTHLRLRLLTLSNSNSNKEGASSAPSRPLQVMTLPKKRHPWWLYILSASLIFGLFFWKRLVPWYRNRL